MTEPQPLLFPEDRAFLNQHGWSAPEETPEQQADRYETLAKVIPDPKLSRAYGQTALSIRAEIRKEQDRIERAAWRAEIKKDAKVKFKKEMLIAFRQWVGIIAAVSLVVYLIALIASPSEQPAPPAPQPPPQTLTCTQVSDTINEFGAKVFPTTNNGQVYNDAWAQLTKEYHEKMGC